MITPTPNVLIVVVNYNGGPFLPRLAACVSALTYPSRRVCIIDNASPDGSARQLPALFPEAKILVNQRNLGFAAAVNQAIGKFLQADTDFVLLLNPDTAFCSDLLERLISYASPHTLLLPKIVSAASGTLLNHAGRVDWRGSVVDPYDGAPPSSFDRPRQVQAAAFACVLIPAAAIRALGPLDERYGMYLEDTDYCLQARRAGFRIVILPEPAIEHEEGASSGGPRGAFTQYYVTRNTPLLMRRHARLAANSLFTPYFSASTARAIAHDLHRGESVLARARLLAVRDFYTGRLGMTFQPSDLAPLDALTSQPRGGTGTSK